MALITALDYSGIALWYIIGAPTLVSQRSPTKPSTQLHWNPPVSLRQVPPCKQGSDWQPSTSSSHLRGHMTCRIINALLASDYALIGYSMCS